MNKTFLTYFISLEAEAEKLWLGIVPYESPRGNYHFQQLERLAHGPFDDDVREKAQELIEMHNDIPF